MANRSRSGLAHFYSPSISKEFVHEDKHLQSKVHKENQGQPSQLWDHLNPVGGKVSHQQRTYISFVGGKVSHQHCGTISIQ